MEKIPLSTIKELTELSDLELKIILEDVEITEIDNQKFVSLDVFTRKYEEYRKNKK